MSDEIKKLKALRPEPLTKAKRPNSPEVVVEMIRAYRRGVSLESIAKAAGRTRGNLYAIIGTWAMKHAQLPQDNER